MKKLSLNLTVLLVILQTTSFICACCDSDPDPVINQETTENQDGTDANNEEAIAPKDTLGGTFNVTNLSYNESTENLSLTALNGDTLKVVFTQKTEYKDKFFSISCDNTKLAKLNDTLYVVKEMQSGDNKINLSAISADSLVSATAELTVNIPKAYVIIPYKVGVSNDLLGFVDAEVTYTDTQGKEHTYVVPDSQWVKSDSVRCQLWEDTNGGLHFVEVGVNQPKDGWTLVEEEMELPIPYYIFNVRYYKTGISSIVTIRYIPKKDVSIDRDSYDFYHKLMRGKAEVQVPNVIYIDNSISFDLTINIGDDGGIKKDKVKDYIDELAKTPDVIKLRIDPGNGGIKEEK